MKKTQLRKVNEILYKALALVLMRHSANEGGIEFPEKDYSWISDDLDLIEVKYFGEPAESSTFKQGLEQNGEPMLTDVEAYNVLTARLNNTRVTDETEGMKYARKCDITGEGMNEGWVIEAGCEHPITGKRIEHIKYKKDALIMAKAMGFKSIADAYGNGNDEDEFYGMSESECAMYWTSWEGQGDDMYIVKDGSLTEIEN